jgi:hypothetical protein
MFIGLLLIPLLTSSAASYSGRATLKQVSVEVQADDNNHANVNFTVKQTESLENTKSMAHFPSDFYFSYYVVSFHSY